MTTPAAIPGAIQRTVLPNGVRVVTEPMPQVRSVSVGVWVAIGSRREAPEENGICHFIEHMLFKGTTSRSAEEIARSVDSIGGNLDAFTAKELVSFNTKVLDEHLPLAFDVLSDLVLHPLFRSEDVEKEKGVILEELKMDQDNPEYLVHEIFTANFWKGHAIGKPILGTKETVRGFTRERIARYYERHYVPSSITITAAGRVSHERMVDLVRERFGRLPARPAAPADAAPATHARIAIRNKKSLEQVQLCMGVPSYPLSHQDRFSCYILNALLGGGMSSRLFQNVREKLGLAYAVFSELNPYSDTGCLSVYAIGPQGGGLHRERVQPAQARTRAQGGAAARQGLHEGLADAEPGIHRRAHGEPGAAGDLLRKVLHAGRTGGEHRARDGRRRAAHRAHLLRAAPDRAHGSGPPERLPDLARRPGVLRRG
jgi:predicted Zn-dependent peptidase